MRRYLDVTLAFTYDAEQIVGRERRGQLDCEFRIANCGFEFAPPRQLNRYAAYSIVTIDVVNRTDSKEKQAYWYEKWPQRLEREKFEFTLAYPALQLATLENGQLMWVGPIRSKGGRQYIIQIVYPHDYPLSPPRVYPVSVDRENIQVRGRVAPSHECHIMADGSLCLYFPSFSASHATAVHFADAAVFWLNGLEHFIETGKFDSPEELNGDPFVGTSIHVDGTVGDINIAGQAGALGTKSQAPDAAFNQIIAGVLPTDLGDLITQLSRLRQEMLTRATELEHYEAVGSIASAEKALKSGHRNVAINLLKRAGTWAFDTATEIGTDVAAEIIKRSIGIV